MEKFKELLHSLIEKMKSRPEFIDRLQRWNHYQESMDFILNEIVKPLLQGLGWEVTDIKSKNSIDLAFKAKNQQIAVFFKPLTGIRSPELLQAISEGINVYQLNSTYSYSFPDTGSFLPKIEHLMRVNFGIVTDGIIWYIFTMNYLGPWRRIDQFNTVVEVIDLLYEEIETSIRKFSLLTLEEKPDSALITGIKQDGGPFKLNIGLDTEKIDLSNNSLIKVDLSNLKNCSGLKSLILNQNELTNLDLSSLSNCTHLESLMLSVNPLMKIDLSPIENLSNLRFLFIARAMLSEIDLSPLAHCTNLEHLDFFGNSLSNIDLTPLKNCDQLKTISLPDNKIKEIDLSAFSEKKSLLSIALNENLLTDIDLSPLSECKNLHSIYLWGNKLSTIVLDPLSNCENLKTLMLSDNDIREIDLRPLDGIDTEQIKIDKAVNIIGNRKKVNFAESEKLGGMDEDEAKSWSFITEGTRLLRLDNLSGATNIYERAFRLNPRNPRIRIAAAIQYLSHRKFENAFDTLYVLIEDKIPLDAETKEKSDKLIQMRQREMMQERLRPRKFDPDANRELFREMIVLHLIIRMIGEDKGTMDLNRKNVEGIIGSDWMVRYDKAYGSPDESTDLINTVLEVVKLASHLSPKDSEMTQMKDWFESQSTLWNNGGISTQEYKESVKKYKNFIDKKKESNN